MRTNGTATGNGITLQWGPKELEELRSQLDLVRSSLRYGADDEIWPPGLSIDQAVSRLVSTVYELRTAIDLAPCLAARPGEMTYECRHDSLCSICKWRSSVIREIQDHNGIV